MKYLRWFINRPLRGGLFIAIGILTTFSLISMFRFLTQPNVPKIKSTYTMYVKQSAKDTCLKYQEILYDFYVSTSKLNIETILIEPSILYCLLPLQDKDLLMKRRFNIENYHGSKNIIHFALIGNNATHLNEIIADNKLRVPNFQNVNLFTGINNFTGDKHFKSHYFFKKSNVLIHAVVFFQTANYFRTFKIQNPKLLENEKMKHLLFSHDDAAYEKFSSAFLKTMEENTSIAIPENLAMFLHQLDSSKFLECDKTRASKLDEKDIILKNDQLKLGFENALQVLKFHLQPQLINFFILSGTLLGWYRQCSLIPYTHDVDFGAWGLDAETSDYWIDTFAKHKQLPLILIMGLPEEALEIRFASVGKPIDLFFAYNYANVTWTPGHLSDYYFWYIYPKFTICSGDLLGYKVLVPCEAEEVLIAEYGKEWDEPVRKWYYNASPRNMGPNIYWSDEKKFKIANMNFKLES